METRLPDEAAALRAAEDADAVFVRWTKVTPDIIRRLRRCRIIVRYGIGYDNVDYGSALAAGIIVGHCPTYCVDEVATHTLALLLACVRDIVNTHTKVAGGGWSDNPTTRQWRMAGRTLGLIGLGNIGRCVAEKLRGWGLRVLATDPFVEDQQAAAAGAQLVDLRTLCREADYICLHAPLLPETRHLLSRRELSLMKDGVIIINTARGPILDEGALLEALDAGKVAAAGLDVFEREPLAPGFTAAESSPAGIDGSRSLVLRELAGRAKAHRGRRSRARLHRRVAARHRLSRGVTQAGAIP